MDRLRGILRHDAFPARGPLLAAAYGLLALLGWLDYATGYELGFFIFYFLPVSMAAWWAGRRDGLVCAVIAALAWFLSDKASHHPYSHAYFLYWETFMRLASFVTTAATLGRIRIGVEAQEALERALATAEAEVARLQAGLTPPAGAPPAPARRAP